MRFPIHALFAVARAIQQRSNTLPLCRLFYGDISVTAVRNALIIYDDLSKQAVAYRQISLLLRVRRDVKHSPRYFL